MALKQSGFGCWLQGEFCGIWGYSDDNLLIAPSLEALQSMITICELYAESHNLLFSTDKDPKKCKTKCMAFLMKKRKKRNLPSMILCGNSLPWVDEAMHLGVKITNSYDGFKGDVLMKRIVKFFKSLGLIILQ